MPQYKTINIYSDIKSRPEKHELNYYVFSQFYAPMNNKLQNYILIAVFSFRLIWTNRKTYFRIFQLIMGFNILFTKTFFDFQGLHY